MFKITDEDMIHIKNIFYDGTNPGYVLDFSDYSFANFNMKSIGLDIKAFYRLSKWRSLETFFLDEQQKISDKLKLLEDLLEYYRLLKLKLSMKQSNMSSQDLGRNDAIQESVNYCKKLIEKYKCIDLTVGDQPNVEVGVKQLLDDARKYSMLDIKTATEKIWDAFERLKTFFVDAQKRIDKKRSSEILVELMANGNSKLKDEINNEFLLLTSIGNNYRIRHHEINKIEIKDEDQYKYLYNRCFSLIWFAISTIEKNK